MKGYHVEEMGCYAGNSWYTVVPQAHHAAGFLELINSGHVKTW